ncbi:MAG: hypothetical protein EB078_01795, partial [Proteobacteria bacterium]|nr:hypothetical protein [Pseudomonadota bacterium]
MNKLFLIFLLGISFLGNATPASSSIPVLKTMEIFSVDQIAGEGQLDFKLGESNESIEFGKDKTHYGLGLVFTQNNLPESYQKMIGDYQVIQIALGNRGNIPADLQPQFGSITIKVKKIPTLRPIRINIQDIQKADKEKRESAFFVFNSSQTKISTDDQEKLKATFFSETGVITLSPIGSAEKVTVKSEGKNLPFKKQMMKLMVNGQVGNPFTTVKGSLLGTVQFPIYWAAETESQELVSGL